MRHPRCVQNFVGGEHVTDEQAVKRLFANIIKQGVEDYAALERRGIVKAGAIVPGAFARLKAEYEAKRKGRYATHGGAIGRGLRSENDARELLLFLWRDMDFLIDAAVLEVRPEAIRDKLGFLHERKKENTTEEENHRQVRCCGRDGEVLAPRADERNLFQEERLAANFQSIAT